MNPVYRSTATLHPVVADFSLRLGFVAVAADFSLRPALPRHPVNTGTDDAGLESPRHRQAGKPALRFMAPMRARVRGWSLPVLAVVLLAFPGRTQATWQSSSDHLAWLDGTNVLWQFNFSSAEGKPFFHPLRPPGGGVLTDARPSDHPWHYGLWFSWKYLNGVNYWEQDRQTGKAQGQTRWTAPVIQTNAAGRATVQLSLEYVRPDGCVELTEQRHLDLSTPAADGTVTLDWTATFRAGTNSVKLDRTPMPGEPNGQVNGGYAGLSLRMAAAPAAIALVTEHGPVNEFASNRARPEARALACNQTLEGKGTGAVAILSHTANLPDRSPWYAVVSDTMRFYCSALLAPRPLTLGPGETLDLRYRILVRPAPWTREDLAQALRAWD